MCNKVRRTSTLKLRKVFGGTLVVEGVEQPELAAFDTEEQTSGFTRPGMPVMISSHPQRFVWMSWGFIPRGQDSMPASKALETPIRNARAETVLSLPSFRDSARHRRCIVPLEGFYEHQHLKPGPGRRTTQEFYIEKCDGLLFAAGIWDEYQGGKTFAIITTQANSLMSRIHNAAERQPHIIDPANWEKWFSVLSDEEVRDMLGIYPDDDLRASEYHRDVPPKPGAAPSLF